MPDINTITINDGATTPAATQFDQSDQINGVTILTNRDANGHLHADRTISISSRKMGDGARKIRIKVNYPILHDVQAEGGSYSSFSQHGIPFENMFAELTFKIPNYASPAQRDDILAFAANVLDHADIVTLVENAEGVW